ncbi:MAG: type II toxin-antitoxin system VapB family antitoxin [Acidimicrobiales bacterium]
MALNIKNPETERMVRELALATGESVTQAVTVATRERLERLRLLAESDAGQRAQRMTEISRDAASLWVEPYRSAAHADLLYDDRGLPR